MAFNNSPDNKTNGLIDFTDDLNARFGDRPLVRPHAAPQRINTQTGFEQVQSPLGNVAKTTGKMVGIGAGVGTVGFVGFKALELANTAIHAGQTLIDQTPRIVHPVNVASNAATYLGDRTVNAANYLGNTNATGAQGWEGLTSLAAIGVISYLGYRVARPTINRFRGHNHSDTIDD